MQSLRLELPQLVFDKLAQVAAQQQQPLEDVVVNLLTQATTNIDPLDALIGSISGAPLDIATHHNEYLGQNLAQKLK